MPRSPYHCPYYLIGSEEVWQQAGEYVSEGKHPKPEPNFEEILTKVLTSRSTKMNPLSMGQIKGAE